jgi:rhamnogalacturonan endolyase
MRCSTGLGEIPKVKEDVYRLTLCTDRVFGMFVEDDVELYRRNKKGRGQLLRFHWQAESVRKEIWRIGIPGRSAAEFRHGRAPYTSKILGPEEYRMYWVGYFFLQIS